MERKPRSTKRSRTRLRISQQASEQLTVFVDPSHIKQETAESNEDGYTVCDDGSAEMKPSSRVMTQVSEDIDGDQVNVTRLVETEPIIVDIAQRIKTEPIVSSVKQEVKQLEVAERALDVDSHLFVKPERGQVLNDTRCQNLMSIDSECDIKTEQLESSDHVDIAPSVTKTEVDQENERDINKTEAQAPTMFVLVPCLTQEVSTRGVPPVYTAEEMYGVVHEGATDNVDVSDTVTEEMSCLYDDIIYSKMEQFYYGLSLPLKRQLWSCFSKIHTQQQFNEFIANFLGKERTNSEGVCDKLALQKSEEILKGFKRIAPRPPAFGEDDSKIWKLN